MKSTTEKNHSRKTRKKARFIVTKDGVDCRLASAVELGMSFIVASGHSPFCSMTGKTGLLVKITPDKCACSFASENGAQKRIQKTISVRDQLSGSMADELPKLKPLLEPGKFSVRISLPN